MSTLRLSPSVDVLLENIKFYRRTRVLYRALSISYDKILKPEIFQNQKIKSCKFLNFILKLSAVLFIFSFL